LQQIQNEYFKEYEQQCMQDTEGCREELARWKAANVTILSLSLDDQATYADYVTRKVCTEQPEHIIVQASSTMFDDLPPNYKLNACSIGNFALLLKTTLELQGHDQLKVSLQKQYDTMIEAQKAMNQNNASGECTLQ